MEIVKKFCVFGIGLVLVFTVSFLAGGTAYAGNGTRMLGFSARDSGMGGATTASPEDTSCLVKNPASLVRIGNRIDAEYQNILPHDVMMNPEGPDVLGPGIPLANRGVNQKSTVEYIPGGDAGISYRIPGTDKYPVSVGCGLFTMSGVDANFRSPRINRNLLTGEYDKMIDLRSMRIAPGIAAAFNNKLSFGATANIAIQGLRSNVATASLAETAGGGKWDFAPGAGFTAGLLYKFNDMLNLGASYESHTWIGSHFKYKDSLPRIDEPPVINVGLALKPTKNFEWTYDTRYINWTDVKLARDVPSRGGFGWKDQWVFATGAEYTFKDKKYNDKLKLRLGYNYGRSPIQSSVVFGNAILPVVMEHHLTTGFSYYLLKDLSLDFVWEHHFMGVQIDNGAGDYYSIRGAGTKITAAAEIISAGIGYKF